MTKRILVLLIVLGCAVPSAAQEPRPTAPTEPPKAWIVNRPGDAKSACPCALAGQWGGCFNRDALQQLTDAAVTKLGSCRTQLKAKDEEIGAVRATLGAVQAQAALLGAASKDRQQATDLTKQAAALVQPLPKSWLERHAFGTGIAIGAVATAALALGIVYAVLPAQPRASAKPSAFGYSPLLWRF